MAEIDERYKRGKIYTIRCRYDDSLIYVGSTINTLAKRMGLHRLDKKCSLYQYVDGDWKNWYIELYEEYPCNNKQLLEKREGEVIREIGTINKQNTGRTLKEWREDNREKIAEQRKEYRQANREKIAEYKKEHYQANRDKLIEHAKEYYQDNRDKLLEYKNEKIRCDICGCEISRQYLKKHQRTKKCMNYNITNK
jgi:hypothetical protein